MTAASARTPSSPRRTSPPRGRITSPRTPRSATSTFDPPPSIVTGTSAARAIVSAVTSLVAAARLDQPFRRSADPECRVRRERHVGRRRSAPNARCMAATNLVTAAPTRGHQRAFLRDQRGHRLARRAHGERDRVARAELPGDGHVRGRSPSQSSDIHPWSGDRPSAESADRMPAPAARRAAWRPK